MPTPTARTVAAPDFNHGTFNEPSASVQDLIDAAIMFCGTPDRVYAQIVEFCEYCGGMGNLIMMGHAGSLFAKEVLPRLKEYKQPRAEAPAAA